MEYRDRLAGMLRSVFSVRDAAYGGFLLVSGSRTVALVAEEADVAARVKALAADGLAALGAVGGDESGETAGLGLLSVHIEETIESDSEVTQVVVRGEGLDVIR